MRHARRWSSLVLVVAGCATPAERAPGPAPQAAEPAPDVAAAVPSSPVPAADEPPPAPEPAPAVAEAPEAPAPAAAPTPVAAPVTWDFKLERNEPWPRPSRGTLATMGYPPSEAEKPFYERVRSKDAMMGMVPVATLSREVGSFGSWFGVVRGYRKDEATKQTRLLLENKHFDGLTDTHILCLSFRGGGDFVAVLPGVGHAMGGLSVVRVYGTVVSVKDDVPRIRAEFVREFPLGDYCFMNVFGEDRGNPRWRELCKVDVSGADPDIYDPGPDLDYYVNLLGHPRDFVEGKVKVEVPLD